MISKPAKPPQSQVSDLRAYESSKPAASSTLPWGPADWFLAPRLHRVEVESGRDQSMVHGRPGVPSGNSRSRNYSESFSKPPEKEFLRIFG